MDENSNRNQSINLTNHRRSTSSQGGVKRRGKRTERGQTATTAFERSRWTSYVRVESKGDEVGTKLVEELRNEVRWSREKR